MSDLRHLPLVSFIVASYNYSQYVGRTLTSILDQTMQNFEIIVIDDGSTDGSLEVVKSFQDPRVRLFINETNIGIVSTYNKGLSLARGQYITFLDSDDWIEPQKIEEQLLFFDRYPETAIVGTYVKAVDKNGDRHSNPQFESWWNQPHDFNAIEGWIGQNKLNACSALITRSVFDQIGLRDPTLSIASDYEFWVRAHSRGYRFGMVSIPLLCYRIHDKNASMKDQQIAFLEQCYVLQKTILSTIESRAARHLLPSAINWVISHHQFSLLNHAQAMRLFASLANPSPCNDCLKFEESILYTDAM
jgi:glycosyltransferase involved in cell wall biosynthesis